MAANEESMLLLLLLSRMRNRRNPRRVWVHEIFQNKEFSEYNTLVRELSSHEDKFFQYFRMSEDQFETLLEMVKPDLTKITTQFRSPVGARERLALCLRWVIASFIVGKPVLGIHVFDIHFIVLFSFFLLRVLIEPQCRRQNWNLIITIDIIIFLVVEYQEIL